MIEVQLAKQNYQPGETIEGKFVWKQTRKGILFDIRLIWFTEGKGTRDHMVFRSQRIEPKEVDGVKSFRFVAPDWPHSFSGQFISLRWAIEAVELPSEEATTVILVIAPEGQEIVLPRIDEAASLAKPIEGLLR